METETHYTPVAKVLHWTVVILLTTEFLTAWIMPEIRGNQSPEFLLNIHMSFGLAIIILLAIRFLWGIRHPAPELSESIPKWQRKLAGLVQRTIYALLVLVPVFGWAWASSSGWDANVFGLFTLPPIISAGSAWGGVASSLHEGLATILLILVGVHVGASLYHFLVVKDQVMQKMLPKKFFKQSQSLYQ